MSAKELTSSVLTNRQVIEPVNTKVLPRLTSLKGLKAIVFDVYGTLIVSGSGDVGSADAGDRGRFIADAVRAVGLESQLTTLPTAEMLHGAIARTNRERTSQECPKPEVDIVEVWRCVLSECGCSVDVRESNVPVRMAADYESRANPTWPMPGGPQLLTSLRQRGLPMGIVSNAQIFTPSLVEDLLEEKDLEAGGFLLDLCVFSNRFRQAKPGPRLFEVLLKGLASRRILPHEAIYVGNDMLNDIWAASQAGLRTAWFAGDARSCRPRQDDPRCGSLRPDAVLTDLMQLLDCMDIK